MKLLYVVYQRHIDSISENAKFITKRLNEANIPCEPVPIDHLQAEDLVGMETVLFVLHEDSHEAEDQAHAFCDNLKNLSEPLNHLTFSILCLGSNLGNHHAGIDSDMEDHLLNHHASIGLGRHLIAFDQTAEIDLWLRLFASEYAPSMCQINHPCLAI